jgi:hypothetical protein
VVNPPVSSRSAGEHDKCCQAGRAGDLDSVHRYHGIDTDTDTIVTAALDVVG